MPSIIIPNPLRSYVNGQAEVSVRGETVGEAVESLLAQFPVMRPHLTNSQGELRPFVNIFLGRTNIRDLKGLVTPLTIDDKLNLVPSIAGG